MSPEGRNVVRRLNLTDIKMEINYRTCDITKEKMQEGYYIEWGKINYIKHEKDLIKHLRDIEKEGNKDYDEDVNEGRLTDEFLLDEYYESGYYFWTDWYDEE